MARSCEVPRDAVLDIGHIMDSFLELWGFTRLVLPDNLPDFGMYRIYCIATLLDNPLMDASENGGTLQHHDVAVETCILGLSECVQNAGFQRLHLLICEG